MFIQHIPTFEENLLKNKSIVALVLVVLAAILSLGVTSAFASDEPCVPSPETTQVIVVTPAVPAVPGTPAVAGQHYSLKGNSGLDKDEVPVFPADYWQANTTQEPHDNGAGQPVTWYPVDPATSGLHFASHGPSGEGKRDWFYYTAPIPEVPGTPEIPAVTKTIVTPAVVCPETPPTTPPGVTETPATETPVPTEVVTPVVEEEDPVVSIEHSSEPGKTVTIKTHESGEVTREVKHYPKNTKEEGL